MKKIKTILLVGTITTIIMTTQVSLAESPMYVDYTITNSSAYTLSFVPLYGGTSKLTTPIPPQGKGTWEIFYGTVSVGGQWVYSAVTVANSDKQQCGTFSLGVSDESSPYAVLMYAQWQAADGNPCNISNLKVNVPNMNSPAIQITIN